MKVSRLELPDVLHLRMQVFRDARGTFHEVWNPTRGQLPGLPSEFVQDNIAFSRHRVLRGMHFQRPNGQGKLVTVLSGRVFDVAVDVRPASPTFGRWIGLELAEDTGDAVYIPEGFAHGYQVLSDSAHVLYKCTDIYHPESEHSLAWNDPEVGIKWPIADPILSDKDRFAPSLEELRARFAAAIPT